MMENKTTGLLVLGGVGAFFVWASRGTKYEPPPPAPVTPKPKLPQPKGMTLEELQALIYREGDSVNLNCPADSGPLKCFIRRQRTSKTLNGYVKIPKSLEDRIVAMHEGRYLSSEKLGRFGVTYGGSCKEIGLGDGICYGFDTSGAYDFAPGSPDFNRGGETYRDMEYAKKKVRELAKIFLPGGEVYSKGYGVEGKTYTRGKREFTQEEREAARYSARNPWWKDE